MKILAVDPGFERVGIAIIESGERNNHQLAFSECFKTSAKIPFSQRLVLVGNEIEKIIKKYKPKAMAIEKLYFTTNQKTAMGVSEARGIMIYCAQKNNLDIYEYTPLEIKMAITGYGKADKNMILKMLPKLIKIEKDKNSDDEFDAIAVGLTCLAYQKIK